MKIPDNIVYKSIDSTTYYRLDDSHTHTASHLHQKLNIQFHIANATSGGARKPAWANSL